MDPVLRLHYVEVREPQLADATGDLQRLFEALERDWQLTGLSADAHVLEMAPRPVQRGPAAAAVDLHRPVGRVPGGASGEQLRLGRPQVRVGP